MRITCNITPGGNVYRLYRQSDQFQFELKRLIPFLLGTEVDMEVGPTDSDPLVMLSIGPFHDGDESVFREKARAFLGP